MVLIAIYYIWYPDNFKECVPADAGNINACPPGSIIKCSQCASHIPPSRWAGKYLPDLGLYSSTDTNVVKSHVFYMQKMGVDVIAVSYWGNQKPNMNNAIDTLFKVLNNPIDNPSGIKFCLYYEDSANRSESIINSDIQFILDHYGDSNYYKINNKPVVFVYGGGDLSFAQKWNRIRTTKGIYIILKEFPGWQTNTNLADWFHQYSPANGYTITSANSVNYSDGVSIRFNRYHACERLAQDDLRFENDLIRMKNSNCKFHIIFWNEWQEGSGLEPATKYNHTLAGPFTPIGQSYGTKYIDFVAKYFNPTISRFSILDIISDTTNIKRGVSAFINPSGMFTKDQACTEIIRILGTMSGTMFFVFDVVDDNNLKIAVAVMNNDTNGKYDKVGAANEACRRLGNIAK